MSEQPGTPSDDAATAAPAAPVAQPGMLTFHCSSCGYGVTIVRALPICPMCGGSSWEQSTWSPFSRSRQRL